MHKHLFTALGIFVIVIGIFLVMRIVYPPTEKDIPNQTQETMQINDSPEGPIVKIREAVFEIEIADTPQEQIQGLSNRESLPQNAGVLFVFTQEGRYDFWMKDMRFPIDIIWIREGVVVDITENALPEGEHPTRIYSAKEPIDMALEVNAGIAAQWGIIVGDDITLAP